MCTEVRGPDSMKCMHIISRDGDHSEGWGRGSTAVWYLSKKSSDLVALPLPQTAMTTRAFFKVCLVLIFLNTIVEKTYPGP